MAVSTYCWLKEMHDAGFMFLRSIDCQKAFAGFAVEHVHWRDMRAVTGICKDAYRRQRSSPLLSRPAGAILPEGFPFAGSHVLDVGRFAIEH